MFRPATQKIGSDGALYVLDYYDQIVGRTTYSFRGPRHIKTRGRVWRIMRGAMIGGGVESNTHPRRPHRSLGSDR